MTTDPAKPSDRRWQFSLRAMFLGMLLVAIAAWFVGWRSWDWDERLLLGCWFIAVSVSILRSRMRLQRGIWRAALAGGLAAAFAYAMYFGLSMADLIFSRAAHDYFLPNVLAAVIVGMFAGGGLAAAFTPSGLEELPPSQRSDRLRHRMTVFVIGATALIGVIAAWSTYERFTAWTAIGSIWPHSSNNRERNLDLAVSADGTRLAIAERNNQLTDPTPATVQLWTIEPFGERPLWSQKVAAVESMAFSPNGKWVAVTAANPFEGVVVLDGASGKQHMVLDVPKSAMRDIPLDLMFSPDSETLTLSSVGGFSDGEPYTTFRTWKTSDWSSLGEQELPGRWFLLASRDELWANNLVNVSDSPYRDAFKVTIAPLRDIEHARTFGPVEEPHPIHISPAGTEVILHNQVIDLREGGIRILPTPIEAVTPDGRYAIGFEQRQPPFPGGFVHKLLFLRHLWPQGTEQRFVVYEFSTGKRVTYSQWLPIFASRLVMARDKTVGATEDYLDWVILWELPIE